MLNIGMDMSQILLPQIEQLSKYDVTKGDNQQINSSSIYSYLNQRGLGRSTDSYQKRYFNAIPYLGYWDIYKNYYANKQEERGYVIHGADLDNDFSVVTAFLTTIDADGTNLSSTNIVGAPQTVDTETNVAEVSLVVKVKWASTTAVAYGTPDPSNLTVEIEGVGYVSTTEFDNILVELIAGDDVAYLLKYTGYNGTRDSAQEWEVTQTSVANVLGIGEGQPQLTEFPLDNIDDMRMDILEAVRDTTAFIVSDASASPCRS
jgi:hypothetical protein